jgi:hypothetical protein
MPDLLMLRSAGPKAQQVPVEDPPKATVEKPEAEVKTEVKGADKGHKKPAK